METTSRTKFLAVSSGGVWKELVILFRSIFRHHCRPRLYFPLCALADWWEWRGGSRLFFWRWPISQRLVARDGYPAYIKGSLPQNRKPQRKEADPGIRSKIKEKLANVRGKGYISQGRVESLTRFFAVPKGESDIRMVYDATASGLNGALWAPTFQLPTIDNLARTVNPGAWMGDLDVAEQFLNFCLDPYLRPFCGVDVSAYCDTSAWEVWTRCCMGLKSSPYFCIKGQLLTTEVVTGDRHDKSNPFRWSDVVLNLPGMDSYDPRQPRVWRARDSDLKQIAAILVQYVDDLRNAGPSEQVCWEAMHKTASLLGYLGIQIAARKTRPPSQLPGPWAGSIVTTTAIGVGVKCTMEKWQKTKAILAALKRLLEAGASLDRKELEKQRGFLVHVARTYPAVVPYLKGLHLTIDSWRPNRDKDGWKSAERDLQEYWDEERQELVTWNDWPREAPRSVKPVPRLYEDIECLSKLFDPEDPPIRYIRSAKVYMAIYGFGDASGSGFGSTFTQKVQKGCINFRMGLWGRDQESLSSNYRELQNLVEALEEGVLKKDLENSEVWILTDNSTAESVYFKGTSTSKALFELVLRLRKLEMGGLMRIQVIHVAGTRMIEQGTDGISRGDFSGGVTAGKSMLSFIPLHLSALERSETILKWIEDWTGQIGLIPLSPSDWFERGHGISSGSKNADGIWIPTETCEQWFVWAPPPAAADVAVDELNVSRHKRGTLNHVVVIPRLMTFSWRKKLQKLCDVVFEIPAGARDFWPAREHEPLIVGLTLAFLPHSPWQGKQSERVLDVVRQLRQVWKVPGGNERDILRKLCIP